MNTVVQSTRDAHGVNEPTRNHGAPPAGGLPDIAGYHIMGELARGGMGRVLAGREERLDREVAIKVLLPGANEGRFLTEAKITARLPHPSIPPVYALGTLSDGSPFLAMKLVRGKTLADELKGRSDTLHDLSRFLQIFEQIAQAAGFAHSQQIIHRDLKPANVMVGAFGEVQVMDWGLAKDLSDTEAVYQRLREGEAPAEHKIDAATVAWEAETPNQQNDQTRSGAILGTPNYMAPEQARGEAVDVRADVFALGGILCAILTGKAVFGGTTVLETVQQAAAGNTADAQARLDASGADGQVVNLAKRCLAVMPSERPADGQAVASLVAGYRQGVEERLKQAETAKAEALVREGEQRKRRRTMQWAAGIIAVVLSAGIIGTGIGLFQAREAEEAEREAKNVAKLRLEQVEAEKKKVIEEKAISTAVKDFLQNKLLTQGDTLEQANQLVSMGRSSSEAELDPKISVLLERANIELVPDKIEASFPNQPLVQAELLQTVGMTYRGIGGKSNDNYAQAISFIERAVALRKKHLGSDHPETMSARHELGMTYFHAGKVPNAIEEFQQVGEFRERHLGLDHISTLATKQNLAMAYLAEGKKTEAIRSLEQLRTIFEAKLGKKHAATILTLNNLCMAYQSSGRTIEAIGLAKSVISMCNGMYGTEHPYTLTSLANLASAYLDSGNNTEAITIFQKVQSTLESKLGADHPETLTVQNNLAAAYLKSEKPGDAIALFLKIITIETTKFGPSHPSTLTTRLNLAAAYCAAKRIHDAINILEELSAIYRAKFGPNHPGFLVTLHNLAKAYLDIQKIPEAIKLFKEVLALQKSTFGQDDPTTITTMFNLAEAHYHAKEYDDAINLLETVRTWQETKLGLAHPNTLKTMNNLGVAYVASGKITEAVNLLEQVLTTEETKFGKLHVETLPTRKNLANAYITAKKLHEAIKLLNEIRQAEENSLVPTNQDTLSTLRRLADAYFMVSNYSEAINYYAQVHIALEKLVGPDHPETTELCTILGIAYLAAGQLEQSITMLERVASGIEKQRFPDKGARLVIPMLVETYEKTRQWEKAEDWRRKWLAVVKSRAGEDGLQYAGQLAALANNLFQQKKWGIAHPLLRECLEIRKKKEPEVWTTFNTHSMLGAALLGQKKYAEAEPLLLKGYEGMASRLPQDTPGADAARLAQNKTLRVTMQTRIVETLDRLIQLYTETNKPKELKKWQAEKDKLPREPAKK